MTASGLERGRVIDGRYRVEETLGSGGMGVVVRATDLHMMEEGEGAQVALKLLQRPTLRKGFVSEFQIQRRLSHPAYPRARHLGSDGVSGPLYAVQDLCLAPVATPGTVLEGSALAVVAAGLMRALDHLHRHGFTHGDLSPNNILLTGDVIIPVRILDLGAAGPVGSGHGETSGLLTYQAPERLEGAPRSPEADLWSTGAVLFGLAYGHHPFPGYPERSGAADEPTTFPDGAGSLEPWLHRLLSREPADRFPSAAAALESLAEVQGHPLELTPAVEIGARSARLPFVDVSEHLARALDRLCGAADAGRPQALTVSGIAGSGRSRLLEEIGHGLLGAGIPCIRAQALQGDRPGELWRRLTAKLGIDVGGPWTEESGVAAVLAVLANVRERQCPLAVIMDDVSRLDHMSQRALEHLVETIESFPDRAGGLLLVTTGESADISLTAWSPESVRALLEGGLPRRRLDQEASEALCAHGHGLSGVLCPLIRELGRGGAITADAGHVHLREGAIQEAQLPDSMESAASVFLDSLDEGTRREASLIGHALAPVPPSLLGAEARDLAREGALLRIGAGDWDLVTLATPALMAAARSHMETEEALRTWMERWRERGRGEGAEAEVHGYGLALGTTEARKAARGAVGRLDPRSSARWIDQVVDEKWPLNAEDCLAAGLSARCAGMMGMAESLFRRGAEAKGSPPDRRGLALLELGEQLGHQARHNEALTALRACLEMEGATGAPWHIRALCATARSAVLTGSLDDATSLLEQGRDLVKTGSREEGDLLYVEGLASYYGGSLKEADGLLRRALEMASATGDLVTQGAIITALGLVAHRSGEHGLAAEHYEQALKLGERARDGARVLTALQNLGVVQQEAGEYTRALASYGEAHHLARSLGQTGRLVQIAGNLGALWCYLGELSRARDVLGRGLLLSRKEENRYLEGVILSVLGEVNLAEESWAEAGQHLGDGISALQDAGAVTEVAEARLAMARLHLERQDFDLARKVASDVLERATSAGNGSLEVQAMALLGAAHGRSIHGDPEESRRHLEGAAERMNEITHLDARWPIWLELFYLAARFGDQSRLAHAAGEVRRLLRQLEDQVPSSHRLAFRTLRERQRAWWITTGQEPAEPGKASRAADTAQEEHWNRLIEVNKRISGEHDQDKLLEYIMDSAVLLSGAERGFLLLPSKGNSDTVEVRVARNLDQENIRKNRLKISRGIATRVLETGEGMLTVDAMEDERYRDQLSVHDLKLRSVLCLPMRARGEVLGAIYLDNRFRTSAFNDGITQRMSAFADQAAIALNNALLMANMAASQRALEEARGEVEVLNRKLQEDLELRTQELATEREVVLRQRQQLTDKHRYELIIGQSEAIHGIFRVMDRLLDNDIPVLIEGESGTGKELVARAIHFNGNRQNGPFVALNCGAIPANLLESELFGYVRGAFTGASADKVGMFEAAHGGTLLLDELGELPLEMQVALLRVLQSGEIRKVGASQESVVSVRVIAATNRRLEEEVAAGRFREDLYYRLAVIPIRVPPLRDRLDDIPMLVQHFIEQNAAAGLGDVKAISRSALTMLSRYPWPGNVRQLEMVLKNASLFANGDTLTPNDFQALPELRSGHGATAGAGLSGKSLAQIEREAIIQALRDNQGNKKRSAERLGIDRRTLYNKLAAYEIVVEKELRVR